MHKACVCIGCSRRRQWKYFWRKARITRGHSWNVADDLLYIRDDGLDEYPTRKFVALRRNIFDAYCAKRGIYVSHCDAGMFEALLGSARKPRVTP